MLKYQLKTTRIFYFFLTAFTFLVLLFSGINSQAQQFVAHLSGNQARTPILTPASGMVTADLTGNQLVVSGSFSGLIGDFNVNVAGGAHIHLGLAGQNGGIQLPLNSELDPDLKGGTFLADSNTFTLTQAQIDALNARQLYVNIHTTVYGSGEIRGQLLPASDDYFNARLHGSNSVPSVMSDGYGSLLFELSGNQLVVSGAFDNLTGDFNAAVGGGSHLHKGLAGETGGIEIFLNATLDADLKGGVYHADSNTFTLSPEQIDLLNDRQLYVNLHTTAVGSGEIRGQVLNMPQMTFRIHLSGSNQPTPLTVPGTGQALIEYRDSTVTISGTFQNLASDLNTAVAGGAHIHNNIAGRNGGIAFFLTPMTDTTNRSGRFLADSNSFAIDSAGIAGLMGRRMYMNIHTMNNGGGELRGQALPQSSFVFNSFLSGTNSVSPRLSTGTGALKAEILGDKLVVTGSFNNLQGDFNPNVAGGSHLHMGFAGSNGGIAFPLTPTLDGDLKGGTFEADSNTFTLSAGMKDTLRTRMLYANIHTTLYTPGEIRGQLLHEATGYFTAPLSGTSSTNPVKSDATGAVNLEWTGTRLIASGSFNNLNSAFNPAVAGGAHIHAAYPGRNGGIQIPLVVSPDTASGLSGVLLPGDNVLTASSGQIDSLMDRLFYVNIHTVDNSSGEIRGSILPLATTYFTTHAKSDNHLGPVVSAATGDLKLTLTGGNLVVSGSFNNLDGDYTNSHLHLGPTGSNGGVQVGLKPTLDGDLRGGVFVADSNRYVLDSAQIADIRSGKFYLNVHSSANPSGEIRGQILEESNFFPNDDATITSPVDGAEILIEGPADSAFVAEWTTASDPDNDATIYSWQLGLDSAFNVILTEAKVGTALMFETTFGVVDSILALNGVNVGDTVALYHRAIASDGSVCTPGMGAQVFLVRGTVTSLDDLIFRNLKLSFFPSPVEDIAHLEIDSDLNTQAKIRIIDMMGRVVAERSVRLFSGLNDVELNFSAYEPGIYFVKLDIQEEPIPALKVIKN